MSASIQYTTSMETLLDWFGNQPCDCATVGYLTDEMDYSRETIRPNLKQLTAAGAAEMVHESTALYRLKHDPRENVGGGPSE